MEKILRTPAEAWAVGGMILIAVLALYVLAFDQGFLPSLAQGAPAFDLNFFHEAFHDARHAAGFPCH
ncbi:MAG: CbtB-domain containing protein [Deltaproteobacteria bacterium]|nr:CbtB-domain containing protein [Deltaproteobacteria bacterium]